MSDSENTSKNGFRVPFGLSTAGRLVSADDATRGEPYSCPACKSTLVHRAGAIKRRHFAHKPSFACTGETVLHQSAKIRIAEVIRAAIQGGPNIIMNVLCNGCDQRFDVAFPANKVDEVRLEGRVESGRIADVLLLQTGIHRFAIEIRVTHAVSPEKSSNFGIHWIELDAQKVLVDPYRWVSLACYLKKSRCPECVEREKRIEAQAKAQPPKAIAPRNYYKEPPKQRKRIRPEPPQTLFVPPRPKPEQEPAPRAAALLQAKCKNCGVFTQDWQEMTYDKSGSEGTCRSCWRLAHPIVKEPVKS